ncbi:MAG: hypothetical protein H5U12_26455 [Hoeflea sp.]|nr:hypothetical protein [Hoeflea sp.]
MMDRLVVLAMGVPQDLDAAPSGDAGDRDTDHEIGPIAAQPPDETACDENTTVRNEVVRSEQSVQAAVTA